ncbi:uncharacterized protein CCOS01_00314 [Colletotrichum costaricense]|uniref:Uncharacterized protein n=1 Tax=Colletotrichum costaricense TaxID=1209916 RepID=A0AAI9Z8U2_9PEZI|nr:uncharacterized protein CCOS01_00314 [Colletotrichum costaricense]KAK1539000.1 hypothetical protein CCOS01_00314 [Colletotrichum costaricense]
MRPTRLKFKDLKSRNILCAVTRVARKLEKRHQPSELEVMLPAKVQSEVRNFLTTTKAMLGLTTTVKTAFSVGFKFTDDDSVPDEEASNLSESLWLQGTYSVDSIRIQGFVTQLYGSARTCRSSYVQADKDYEMENQEFFKAVSDDIWAKGITCKALHELFIRGRKAYLRDLVESEKMKEGVYTKKMKELIGAVEYWMRFFEQDDEACRGVTDDNEMFTVFNEVAL